MADPLLDQAHRFIQLYQKSRPGAARLVQALVDAIGHARDERDDAIGANILNREALKRTRGARQQTQEEIEWAIGFGWTCCETKAGPFGEPVETGEAAITAYRARLQYETDAKGK